MWNGCSEMRETGRDERKGDERDMEEEEKDRKRKG
jgi:hypothetical protein